MSDDKRPEMPSEYWQRVNAQKSPGQVQAEVILEMRNVPLRGETPFETRVRLNSR